MDTLTLPRLPGDASLGVSAEAKYLRDDAEKDWESLQKSRAVGIADLFEDLAELADECAEPDWDGYGAVAIGLETIQEAQRFLRALPFGMHRPTLGAEPDGHVTFEWYASPKRTLSVSISADATLHYAALIGSSRQFGSEPFLGDCPDAILDLIYRVMQA